MCNCIIITVVISTILVKTSIQTTAPSHLPFIVKQVSDQQKIQQERLLQQSQLQLKQQQNFPSLENHEKNNGQGFHGQSDDFKLIKLTSGHDFTVSKNLDTKKKNVDAPRYEGPRSDLGDGKRRSEKGTVKEVKRVADQGSRVMINSKGGKSVESLGFERASSESNQGRRSVESGGRIDQETGVEWDDEQFMETKKLTRHVQPKDDKIMNDAKITSIMTTDTDRISKLRQKMATPTSPSTLSSQKIVTATEGGGANGIEKRQDQTARPVWQSRAPSLLSSNGQGTQSTWSFPKESQYSSSKQQMAPPSHEPEVRLDYPDLKGRYNYFPPSMFVNYEQEARDKIYNTIHGQIDANGFFLPANQLRGSSPNYQKSHHLASSTIGTQQVSPSNMSRSQSGYDPLNGNYRPPTPYHGYGLSPTGASSSSVHASTHGHSDKGKFPHFLFPIFLN